MKNRYLLLFSFLIILSSCITIQTTSNGFKDEIYYSENDYEKDNIFTEQAEEEVQAQVVVEEEVVTQEEYDDSYRRDDYYDYGYSSRLRRFHGPQIGFSYYHNYYTNSFWYNSNPHNYGVSIYYGYNFWNPHYNNYYNPWYHGYQYGYGYSHHYYHPHHNNYWYGYNAGLYASNSNPTYYNSFDNNSIYYGPNVNNNARTPQSFANKFNQQTPADIQNSLVKRPIKEEKIPSSVVRRPSQNANQSQSSSIKNPTRVNTSISKPVYTKPVRNNSKPASNVNKPVSVPKPTYTKPKPAKKPANTYNKLTNTSRSPSRSASPSRSSSPSRNSSPRSNSRKPRK